MRLLLALSGAACVALAGAAGAQAAGEGGASPRTVEVNGLPPFLVVGAQGAFGRPNYAVGFYLYWDLPRTSGGRARLAARRVDRERSGAETVRWATEAACPALEPLLRAVDGLETPRVTFRRPEEVREINIVGDGVSYRLWQPFPEYAGYSGYGIEFGSNVNTPLAVWADRMDRETADCWRAEPPAGATVAEGRGE